MKGNENVGKLHIDNFTVKGAGNVFTLDADTKLTATVTFADGKSELVTDLATAYKDIEKTSAEVNGVKTEVVTGAAAKLGVVAAADGGGKLSITDAFTYSTEGLSALVGAYSKLTLVLDNASLYVPTPAAGESGSSTVTIPSQAVVNLPTQGTNDISGGADEFKIKGTVNVVANTGSDDVAGNNTATLSNVSVEGTSEKKAELNLHEVDATADTITLENATLTIGSAVSKETAAPAPEAPKKASLVVTNLVAGEGSTILVGNKEAKGVVEVDKFSSKKGSVVFADPAWNTDPALRTVANASGLAVAEVSGAIEGTVAAGQNSFIAFGTNLATAQQMVTKTTGWSEDSTGAAIVVAAPIEIGGGAVVADASLTSAPTTVAAGQLTVAAGSALIVDQNAMPAEGALITGDLVVANGGSLGVVNAHEGAFNLATTVTGVDAEDIVLDNPFLDPVSFAGGVLTTRANAEDMSTLVTSFGMQALTRRVDSALAASVADRTSFDQRIEEGISLWADVSGERYEADSLDNGGSFKSDMGYAVFGGDIGITPTVRAGAAVQYATGSLRSDVANAKNDFDAFGFTAYGSWQPCAQGMLVGELAYVQGTSELTNTIAAASGDVDTTMYSAGIRAQYKGTLGQFSIVPSIGVRVSRLETDAFALAGVNVEKQKQTLVQVPLAVRINGAEFNANGWQVAPSFKLAYVPTFGDKEITIRSVDSTVIDTSPVQGEFGIRAANGNLMLNADMLVGGGKDGASSIGAKIGVRYLF